MTAECFVEGVLLCAEFDHARSDNDPLAIAEMRQDINCHSRTRGVRVERVIDYRHTAGSFFNAQTVLDLFDRRDRISDLFRRHTKTQRNYNGCQNI